LLDDALGIITDVYATAAILHRRLDTARKEAASQRSAFKVFSLQQAEQVPAWKKMVEDFEADGTKKNPYELKVSGMTTPHDSRRIS
jgi:hypothetical protein